MMMAGTLHWFWQCWYGWLVRVGANAGLHAFVSTEPLAKFYAEPALTLSPLCDDLNSEHLLIPFLLMCDLRN